MDYCMYLRKSRADLELEARGEMETLARHEKILLDVAKRMKLNVTKIYREIVSGETISARPIMQQLIEEVEQGLWAGVLVTEVERLARGDTIDQGIVARAFQIENTKIITPLKVYDPSNEYDEEYFEFGLFMSRREYKTIRRRIERGRLQSAKDGKFVASVPPYGYDRVRIPDDKGYTLQPNAEADTVRAIYDWYINGDGCTVIARKLDDLHIKPRVSDRWSKASIKDILCNPVYIGKIRWQDKVTKNTSSGKSTVKNDAPILVDGLHDAIISKSDFDLVQSIMAANRRLPVKKDLTLKNPLAGLGYCAKCGSKMDRLGVNHHCAYPTLRCSNRYCDNVSAPLELVEREVVRQLIEAIDAYFVTVDSAENRPNTGGQSILAKSITDAETELQKVEKQILAAYDLLEQGVYSTDVFTQRQKALSAKKEELNESIADMRRAADDEAAALEQASHIPEIRRVLDGYWHLDNAKDRNDVLRTILKSFTYQKDTQNRKGQRYNQNFSVTVYPKLPDLF